MMKSKRTASHGPFTPHEEEPEARPNPGAGQEHHPEEDSQICDLQSRARIGKIARLPLGIRDELNDRLADGEPGDSILRWLNGHPEVIKVLNKSFGGRPILKQNLSAWRRGGHEDWVRHGEALRFMARMSRESHELSLMTRQGSLNDNVAQLLAVRVASVVHATRDVKDWSRPRQLERLLSLCSAVSSLRRGDHAAERLRLDKKLIEVKETDQRLQAEQLMKRNMDQLRDFWTRTWMLLPECFDTDEKRLAAMDAIMFGEEGEDILKSIRRVVAELKGQGQSRLIKPKKPRHNEASP